MANSSSQNLIGPILPNFPSPLHPHPSSSITVTRHIHTHPPGRYTLASTHSITSSKITKSVMSEHEVVTTTTRSTSLATGGGSANYTAVKTTKTPLTPEVLEDALQRNAASLVPAWDRVRDAEKALAAHQEQAPPVDASEAVSRKWRAERDRLTKRLDGLRTFRDCLGTQRANLLRRLDKLTGDYRRGRWGGSHRDHDHSHDHDRSHDPGYGFSQGHGHGHGHSYGYGYGYDATGGPPLHEHARGDAHARTGPLVLRGDRSEHDISSQHGLVFPSATEHRASPAIHLGTYSSKRKGKGKGRGRGRSVGADAFTDAALGYGAPGGGGSSGLRGKVEMAAGYESAEDTEWHDSSVSGGIHFG